MRQVYSNFEVLGRAVADRPDMKPLLSLYSDDVEWHVPAMENVPFAGPRRGIAGVRDFFAAITEGLEVLQFEPREYIAQGDKVVALGRYSWRVRATGRVQLGLRPRVHDPQRQDRSLPRVHGHRGRCARTGSVEPAPDLGLVPIDRALARQLACAPAPDGIRTLDPRDQTSEVDDPAYRAYFCEPWWDRRLVERPPCLR